MNLDTWQLVLVLLGALTLGASKAGLGGLGLLTSVIFANAMPAKQATGFALPLLIFGDLIAVKLYRRHARWSQIFPLLPWTAAGIIIGWLTLSRISDQQARVLIGALVLSLLATHLIRRHLAARQGRIPEHGPWFGRGVGVIAGFATLIANASGPLMTVYLLAMRLPKMEFVGTSAVFYLIMNLFKAPFMANLGMLGADSLRMNLMLLPLVAFGTWAGHRLLARIDQRLFENLTYTLSALSALRLLLS